MPLQNPSTQSPWRFGRGMVGGPSSDYVCVAGHTFLISAVVPASALPAAQIVGPEGKVIAVAAH